MAIQTRGFEGINVTPLIDVVMCLIIFFLIVGKLASDASAVRLPGSAVGRVPGEDGGRRPLVISMALASAPGATPPVSWGGVMARVFVDGQSVSGPGELEGLLRERLGGSPAATEPGAMPAQRPVHLRADRDLPWDAVQPVLQACSKAGVLGVRLATERPR